jgi:homoserine kinase
VALTLSAELGLVDAGAEHDPDGAGDRGVPDGARRCDVHHPASIAFARSGGIGEVWERCSIPAGRGLGFSGAVRVGGAVLALAQRDGLTALDDDHRAEALAVVAELEGHADNVAASLYGGVVATADGQVVRVPLALDPAIVVWIPSFVTKTDESRRALGGEVPFADAVFNIGRVAMLVGALAAGDVPALRLAVQDRLHQPVRFAGAAPSRAAVDAAMDAGAWCSWLSGSGPTVAAMCAVADADDLAAAMPADGHVKVLRIDHEGATIEAPYTRSHVG